MKKLDQAQLMDYALRTLAGRALSSGELRSRLLRRAVDSADVEKVLGRLKDYGYLSDKRFAENFATARLENQGLGRQRVLRDLRQRRVAPELAEKAVKAAYAGADETLLIEQYLRRKYRKVDLPAHLADPSRLAAAYRKLRYAGFSSGNVIRVLKKYSEMADQLEGQEEG